MILDSLTTEVLRKKFKNNFDLCNFGINVARNVIMGGQQATIDEIIEIISIRADEHNEHNGKNALNS
jgi:hypothetical protein